MLPLEGIRILAPTQLGAGPYGMTLLADLGAEVIKIENPRTAGDEARSVPPHARNDDSLYYQSLNRNSKSITLNLEDEQGQEIFRNLVAVSDAVFNNLRGDIPDRFGLTYETLKLVNPKIVCVSLSGFGRTGPQMKEPAYDYLFQAYTGIMSLTGEPDGPPSRCGISFVDFAGGLAAAAALPIGLLQAQRKGVGCDLDISLFDVALSQLNYLATWILNTDYIAERTRNSAHPTIVPCQAFQTKDGWIIVMCMKQKFWERLCTLMNQKGLQKDPKFESMRSRYDNRNELIPILSKEFLHKSTSEWLSILRNNVPCAPINSVDQALNDPEIRARNMIIEINHPSFGKVKEIGCPVKVQGANHVYKSASPLGGSNQEILGDLLKLSDSRIADLHDKGVI